MDIRPCEDESQEAFGQRREELVAAIKPMEGEGVEVVVRARKRGPDEFVSSYKVVSYSAPLRPNACHILRVSKG